MRNSSERSRKKARVARVATVNYPDPAPLSPILASALDAFYESGYHGTSVRDIAQRAKLTVPALYYHYTNKEAILLALLNTSIDSVIEWASLALDRAGEHPADRFLNLIESLSLYIATHVKSAAMDAEIRVLSPQHLRAYGERRRIVAQMLTDTIAEGVRRQVFEVTDSRETSRAILGMIQAIAIWYDPGGLLSPADVARRYVDIAAHAVGATPDILKRARQSTGTGTSAAVY
jgi:AcrR family transcriptional regulator